MSEAMPLQPEQTLARGRFVLVKRLGRGGMGEVWLARDERLREPVALKFLPPEIRGDPGALDDLRRETARSHHLSHPNIVRIHDLFEDPDGTAFIVMEYIDGPTLAAVRLEQSSGVLSWYYLRPLVAQLCAALEYAHGEKVIHRDLKPANLMVDSRGRLKLADFGIAAVASDSMSRISVRHSTSGTLPYMSPQQVTGKRPQAADDIYALGATIYELLTSKLPFHSGNITHQILYQSPEPMEERLAALEMQNDIPPDVAALIMACLAKEPGQRPRSARAVAEWIGVELVVKPSTESLAAALFPQGPSRSEAVGSDPAGEDRTTPAGDGGPPIPIGMLRAGKGGSKPAGYGRKLAAVGIVLLVIAAAFWLRKDILSRRDDSKVTAPPPEMQVKQTPTPATPLTPPSPAPSTTTAAQTSPQGTVTNTAVSNSIEWISSQVPKPGADGWIVLFDGKRLYGSSPPVADPPSAGGASDKLSVEDGCLRLDSTRLRFNVRGRDIVIRARLKKVSGQNCSLFARDINNGQDCAGAVFDGGNGFTLGKEVDRQWKNLAHVRAQENYDGFFEMEFRAEGANLAIKAGGQSICVAQDNSVTEGGIGVDAFNGIALFQSIEARILDKTPAVATPVTTTTPAPSTTIAAQPPPGGTVTNPAAPNLPGWISPQVPKPGADGWIVLFDGKQLYGCSPPAADIASGKVSIQDGCLRLDSITLGFNLIGRDMVIRARLKKASGANCDLIARNDGQNNGRGRDCEGCFIDGNYFFVGHHVDQPWRDLVTARTRENHPGFFEMEFRVEGENLTLKADGQDICHARENSIMEAGTIGVKTLDGIALYQTIEAQILDKRTAMETRVTTAAPANAGASPAGQR